MKFFKGMVIGGMMAIGATWMYSELMPKNDSKKIIKKGRQFVKKMGLM